MLYNYFVIAFRNILKQKVFSFINVLGLTIGITCCILLALFIHYEFSYEKHFKDYQNIYRVTSILESDQWSSTIPCTAPPMVPTFQREFPEIQSATRVVIPPDVQRHYLRFEDKGFYETRGYVVDSTFFDVFSYPFEEGDPATALDGASPVVLSHDLARKFFADASALDQILIITSGGIADTFHVTGVLKPYEHPSQLDAGFYMGMNNKGWGKIINDMQSWVQTFIYSFVKLKQGTLVDNLTAKMPALMEKHGAKELKAMGFKSTPGLQPLKDMHLYSAQEFTSATALTDIGTSGNIMSVYVIASICLFILLIACINFINLTTAKAFQRAGEVGVRKSLGASRTVLIRQFLGESLLITAIAMILSVVFVQLALPIFNSIAQKNLSINGQNIGFIALMLVGISIVTGVISGSYPAFYLSAFQPARVLKEKYVSANSTGWLRKSLVVFQFVISIALISSILIIRKQISFVQNMPLGFNPEYKITIPIQTGEAKAGYQNLKNRIKQLANVSEVSASSALPATPTVRTLPLYRDGATAEGAVPHYWISIDENYFDMLGVKLLQGRNLNAATDTAGFLAPLTRIVVNEASLKETNIEPEKAIGTKLQVDLNGQNLKFEIVGVVQDFHQFSMHKSLAPMMFMIPKPEMMDYSALCVATGAANFEGTLTELKKIWKELMPNSIFEYSILTDNIKQQYEADQRVFAVSAIFTTIAIVISCLGLYGLSIFTAERKVKEIGIRKVFGANVSQIVGILSFDFIKLVLIAIVIAIPVGYYAMNAWLENFAYKIEMDAAIFILAGFMAITIAGLTIGFEALKAALKNPVDSIRNE